MTSRPPWGPVDDGEPVDPHEPYTGPPAGPAGDPEYGQQYPTQQYGADPYGQQYPTQQYGADPYGQQYPTQQYPTQRYGADPYGQQYPQAPYAAGPPSSRRGTVIALLVAAAVAVAGVLAAVIALHDSGNDASVAAPTGPTAFPSVTTPAPSQQPATNGPATGVPNSGAVSATLAGIRFYTALTTHDVGAATSVTCPGAGLGLTQARLAGVGAALPDGPATASGASATMNGTLVRTSGTRGDLVVRLRDVSSQWCVAGVTGL